MGREETWITRRESKSGPGRAELPPKRPTVAAVDTGLWDEDEGGAAGVREPRRPRPPGPLFDAGERPEPEPLVYLTLSEARR